MQWKLGSCALAMRLYIYYKVYAGIPTLIYAHISALQGKKKNASGYARANSPWGISPPAPQRAHTEWNEFGWLSARGSRERGGQVLKSQRVWRGSARNRNKKKSWCTHRLLVVIHRQSLNTQHSNKATGEIEDTITRFIFS